MKPKYLLLIVLLRMKCSFEAADEENFTFYATTGTSLNHNNDIYLIPFGGDIDLYCTGESGDADRLNISLIDPLNETISLKPTQTEIVNKTTIRLKLKKQEHNVVCQCLDTLYNDSQFLTIYIFAGNATGISNFSCIYDDYYTLNCTWDFEVHFESCNFSLSVVKNGKLYTICQRGANDPSKFFSWNIGSWRPEIYDLDIYYDDELDGVEPITFHAQTCNEFGCAQQTFLINLKSIFKLRPPRYLEVLDKSYYSAHLNWVINDGLEYPDEVDHDVECWHRTQAGNKPCEANTLNIYTDQHYSYIKHLKLDLLCPDTYYDVRISIRPATGTEDRLWSDFATISFKTDKKTEKGLVNPMCEGKDKAAEYIKGYLRSKLSNVTNNVLGEISQIKNRLKKLKEKAARIKQGYVN